MEISFPRKNALKASQVLAEEVSSGLLGSINILISAAICSLTESEYNKLLFRDHENSFVAFGPQIKVLSTHAWSEYNFNPILEPQILLLSDLEIKM